VERSFAHCYEIGGLEALPSAGTGEHSEAATDSCGSLQSESGSAQTDGCGQTARVEKPMLEACLCSFASTAWTGNGTFAHWIASDCLGRVQYKKKPLLLPTSPPTDFQQFCHGLLASGCGVWWPEAKVRATIMRRCFRNRSRRPEGDGHCLGGTEPESPISIWLSDAHAKLTAKGKRQGQISCSRIRLARLGEWDALEAERTQSFINSSPPALEWFK
jgi:hypothetical protein